MSKKPEDGSLERLVRYPCTRSWYITKLVTADGTWQSGSQRQCLGVTFIYRVLRSRCWIVTIQEDPTTRVCIFECSFMNCNFSSPGCSNPSTLYVVEPETVCALGDEFATLLQWKRPDILLPSHYLGDRSTPGYLPRTVMIIAGIKLPSVLSSWTRSIIKDDSECASVAVWRRHQNLVSIDAMTTEGCAWHRRSVERNSTRGAPLTLHCIALASLYLGSNCLVGGFLAWSTVGDWVFLVKETAITEKGHS